MAAHSAPELPSRPIDRLTQPFVRFLHVQSASGVVLLLCTVAAVAIGNSNLAEGYQQFWAQEFRIGFEWFELQYPLWYWVNDALMAIFFFVIGLEIKRELVIGELREIRRVVLPIAAAAGGVVVPVAVYLSFQYGKPGQDGWAVPMATDIAFVVGCLALLGDRVPHGLKVMMLSLAIVDDLFAVGVIAIFFTESIELGWGAAALAGFVVIVGMRKVAIRHTAAYVIVGAFIWLCTLKSGVHPTVAGVALGLLTPTDAWLDRDAFDRVLGWARRLLYDDAVDVDEGARRQTLQDLSFASREAISPLARIEGALHPWVAFGIMPVFALANAAVPVSAGSLTEPVAMAVLLGLFVGKPLGIFVFSWVTVKLGWAQRPSGVSWSMLFGAACLGGIGFTMALFIAALGLEGETLTAAKTGILIGSLLSAVLGMSILGWVFRRSEG